MRVRALRTRQMWYTVEGDLHFKIGVLRVDLQPFLPACVCPAFVDVWLVRRGDGDAAAQVVLLLRAWVPTVFTRRHSSKSVGVPCCIKHALHQHEIIRVVAIWLPPRRHIVACRDAEPMLECHQGVVTGARLTKLTDVLDVPDPR